MDIYIVIKNIAAASVLDLLLDSDNFLPGYEQLSYSQRNQNLSTWAC